MNKLRLKIGSAEVEYEGSDAISKTDIFELLERLSAMPQAASPGGSAALNPPNGAVGGATILDLGVDSIAAKLGVKTGPELLGAGALFLETVRGKTAYSRKELLDAARSGSGYYTDGVRKNLSNYLRSLVTSGKLNKRGDNQYSLSADAKKDMLNKIG